MFFLLKIKEISIKFKKNDLSATSEMFIINLTGNNRIFKVGEVLWELMVKGKSDGGVCF